MTSAEYPAIPAPRRIRLGRFLPQTLGGQAIALLLGTVVITAMLSYTVFNHFVAKTFEASLKRRGESLVSVLQQHQELRLALSLRDRDHANRVAQELLQGDSDARYALFLDGDGNVLGQSIAPDIKMDAKTLAATHLATKEEELGGETDALIFTREVAREQSGSRSELPEESDSPKRTVLGKILIGLSARTAREQLGRQTLAIVFFTAFVLVLAFIAFFASMARRLNRMAAFAAKVAGGDLVATLTEDHGRDEISKLSTSLRELTRKTGTMVGRLQDAARALADASTEILTSSSQQGQSATRQASSVAETGATVTELRETFHQAAERAQTVIDLAKRSEESTQSGRLAVQESVAAMEQIRDQVLTISRTILGLVERTNQIGTIIDAVNDLAEQSNVLALNAAIEAAKAGDHGRGFAVVAREVRTLAERSKDSTSQVRTILQDIEKASRDALGVMEEGTRKTQVGMELANRAGESIQTLDRAINESSTAAKQIASSTRQQAVGVEQIWQAMREIDRVVNESASGIRQLESASKNMKDLSDAMTQLVTQYNVAREAYVGMGDSEATS